MRKQKTIKKEILIEGVGLHTGKKVHLKFKPAPINTGICFVRTDLAHKPIIKADIQNVFKEKGVARCTPIGAGEATIYTIEHLMSI
ncbi:MAG TPA: UDP-3-O-acyl-N-acetylglucosamine deacetylase, partial [Candidatus Omnitrophota bacterium]|nr:UDP-3-O-acyl-N-acetylglucosamine deacetylase [Candidatus Omnitrophota bacterium]